METIRCMIFGAGATGMEALEIIGFGRVECFIDNKKFGNSHFGKNVISFDEFLDKKDDNTVVAVASEKYCREIKMQPDMVGYKKYFIYKNVDLWRLRSFMPRYCLFRHAETVSYARVFEKNKINRFKRICVYGDNEMLHYLLMEIAYQNSFDCIKGIVKTTHTADFDFGIEEKSLEDVWDEIDCLIINCRRNENFVFDVIEEKKHSFEIISLYDIDSFEPSFEHPELGKYKDIHKGHRIWLIGNGPSMRVEDLNTLYRNGEICFGFNQIYKVYKQTDWRADYLAVADSRVMIACKDELSKYEGRIFMSDEYNRTTELYFDNVEYVHLNGEHSFPWYPQFSNDIVKCIYFGYTSVYDIGMQFAAYMGASEIYLLGVDNSFVGEVTDERNHFIKDYYSESDKELYIGAEPNSKVIERSYEKAEKYSRTHGFRIFNATRGGAVEAFERVNFDEIFEGK